MASSLNMSSSEEDKSSTENLSGNEEKTDMLLYSEDSSPSFSFSYYNFDSDEDQGPKSMFDVNKPFHVPGQYRDNACKSNNKKQNVTDSEIKGDKNIESIEQCTKTVHIFSKDGGNTLTKPAEMLSGAKSCGTVGKDSEVDIFSDKHKYRNENQNEIKGRLQSAMEAEFLSKTDNDSSIMANKQKQKPPKPDVTATKNLQRDNTYVNSNQLSNVLAQSGGIPLYQDDVIIKDSNDNFTINDDRDTHVADIAYRPKPVLRRVRLIKSEQLNQAGISHNEEKIHHCEFQSMVHPNVEHQNPDENGDDHGERKVILYEDNRTNNKYMHAIKDPSYTAANNTSSFKVIDGLEKERFCEGVKKDEFAHVYFSESTIFEGSISQENFVIIDEQDWSSKQNSVDYVNNVSDIVSEFLQVDGTEITLPNNSIDDSDKKDIERYETENKECDHPKTIKAHIAEAEVKAIERIQSCEKNLTANEFKINREGTNNPIYNKEEFKHSTEVVQDESIVIGFDSTQKIGYQNITNIASESKLNMSPSNVALSITENDKADKNHPVLTVKGQISMCEPQGPMKKHKYQTSDESFVVICSNSAVETGCQSISSDVSANEHVSESNSENGEAHTIHFRSIENLISMFETQMTPQDGDTSKTKKANSRADMGATCVKMQSNKKTVCAVENDVTLHDQSEMIKETGSDQKFNVASPAKVPKMAEDIAKFPPYIFPTENLLDHSKAFHMDTKNESGHESHIMVETPEYSVCGEATQTCTDKQTQNQEYLTSEKLGITKYGQFDQTSHPPPIYPRQYHHYTQNQPQNYIYIDENGQYLYRNPYAYISYNGLPQLPFNMNPYAYNPGIFLPQLNCHNMNPYAHNPGMVLPQQDNEFHDNLLSTSSSLLQKAKIEATNTTSVSNNAAPMVKLALVPSQQETTQSSIISTPIQIPHKVSGQNQGSGNSAGHKGGKQAVSKQSSSRKLKYEEQLSLQNPQKIPKINGNEQRQDMEKQTYKSKQAVKQEPKMKVQVQLCDSKHSIEDKEHNIYVKGLNPTTDKEAIINFFEALSGSEVISEKVIFDYTRTCALVVIKSKPDMNRLKNRIATKGIDKHKPAICEVKEPSRIAVSCNKPLTNSEAIGLYFAREKSGGGTIVGEVQESEDGSCLIVEFEDKQMVKQVCERNEPHILDGNRLRVSPYYTCDAGSIWDSHLHSVQIPEKIVQPISAGWSDFLQSDCCKERLSQFKKVHCCLTFTDHQIEISCTLTPSVPGFKNHVSTWSNDVKKYVEKYIYKDIQDSTVAIKSLLDMPSDSSIEDKVWENVQRYLNFELTHNLHITVMLVDEHLKQVTFIGYTDSVREDVAKLTNQVKEIGKQLRKTKCTLSPAHLKLRLLQKMNLFQDIQNNFSDVKISTTETVVTIEGHPEDVEGVKIKIYEALNCIHESKFGHSFDTECVKFINTKLIQHLNKLIQKAGLYKVEWEIGEYEIIVISWKITTNLKCVYANIEGCNSNVNKIIQTTIQQKTVDIQNDDLDVLESKEWDAFLKDLRETYKHRADVISQKTYHRNVIIFGLSDDVDMIEKEVADFIEDNKIRIKKFFYEDIHKMFIAKLYPNFLIDLKKDLKQWKICLQFEENVVKIEGKNEGIMKAREELKKLFDTIVCVPHTICKVAVKEVFNEEKYIGKIADIEVNTRCLIQLPKEMVDREKTDLSSAIQYNTQKQNKDHKSAHTGKSQKPKTVKAKNGLTISLVKGIIGKQSAHVLVVAVAPSLNLKSGKACESLLEEGGQSLQDECDALKPDGIQPGEIVCIRGGKLGCKRVYLTTFADWISEDKPLKVLQKVMTDSLKMASAHNICSIAFTAMATGQLNYPANLVAATMYQAAVEFDYNNPKTSVKDVQFVCYHDDVQTILCFEEEQMRIANGGGRHTYNHKSAHTGKSQKPKTVKAKNGLTISLVKGIIGKQSAHVLVVAVAPSLNLKSGKACESLLEEGGQSLQDECYALKPDGIQPGEIVCIRGGKLGCKRVYLTTFADWISEDKPLKVLQKVMTDSLKMASAHNICSIAFTAMATGQLNYPANLVAATMYQAAVEFDYKNPKTSVKDVQFVCYHDNLKTIQCFEEEQMRIANGGGRHTYRLQNGPIVIEVVVEDLAKQKVDCILCTISKSMDMQYGACGALLKAGGTSLQDECRTKYNNHIAAGDVVSIAPGTLHCKCLYLTVLPKHQKQGALETLKSVIETALDHANKNCYTTVAMPALGSGILNYPHDDVCKSMFDTVIRWGMKPHGSYCHVKSVRFVLYYKDHGLIKKFMDYITITQKKVPRPNRGIEHSHSSINRTGNENPYSQYMGHGNLSGLDTLNITSKQKQEIMSKLSSLNIDIYSDSKENVYQCIRELEAMLEERYTTKEIEEYRDLIKQLDKTQVNQLDAELLALVDITIDQKAGIIVIKGPIKQVDYANTHLSTQLLKIYRKMGEEKSSNELVKLIQWFYEEVTKTGLVLKPYEKYVNFKIEQAFNNNQTQFELTSEDGNSKYIIDFDKFEEYAEHDVTDTVRVIRKNVLKSASLPSPENWVTMSPSENIKCVGLSRHDKDYQVIVTRFLKEVKTGAFSNSPGIKFDKNNLKVTKIERIQNKTLYQLYQAKKKLMEEDKPNLPQNMPLERLLWHGTSQAAIDSIKMYGFNRSYCGKNGTWFGAGVYFAKDVSYCCREWLTNDNPQTNASSAIKPTISTATAPTKGSMFLAKVLTGQYCQGKKGMRYLHAVDPAKPLILYDCSVDNLQDPMEFAIYHDTQAYPEYVLTFQA